MLYLTGLPLIELQSLLLSVIQPLSELRLLFLLIELSQI